MSDSVTGQYVTLTSDGEQTGRFLPIVQSSVDSIDSEPAHIDLDSQPLTPGASGLLTLTNPNTLPDGGSGATDPYVIEFKPTTYEGDTTPTSEGQGIPVGVRDKVYLIPATIPEFSLNGGDDQTTIAAASPLNYIGPASLIDAFGGISTITATGSNETIAAGGAGGNVITMQGDGDQLYVDSGSNGLYTDTGNNAVWVIGSASGAQPTTASASTKMEVASGNDISLIDPTASDLLLINGTANTVVGSAGNETISATIAGNVVNDGSGNANIEFVSSNVGVNTVVTGSGNATIFGQGGVLYYAGSGKDLYVGGDGQSTIVGGVGNQTLFGGTGGEIVYVNRSHDIIVNGGGSDTILGASDYASLNPGGIHSIPQVTLFGNSGGDDRLISAGPGILVAGGGTETINASSNTAGNDFFVNNAPAIGNTTLVGSTENSTTSAFSDLFVVGSVVGANYTPHTITIEDFHTSDAFFLSGYGAGDMATFANAVTNDPTPTGNLSVALSDGTTVSFVGGHPTNIFNGGAVAT